MGRCVALLLAAALMGSPIALASPGEALSSQPSVFVRTFRLEGNRVFSTAELAAVTAPYENRMVSAEELQEVRHRLTLYYVERGYINSGAILPDQEVGDGVVRVRIVEGTLTAVELEGLERLRPEYLEERLHRAAGAPLHLPRLRESLQLLQEGGLIERVNAQLHPGTRLGEATLRAQVVEARPQWFGLRAANDRPPSVGAEYAELLVGHRDLSGRGDSLSARMGLAEGTRDFGMRYVHPLSAADTTVAVYYNRSSALVVEAAFADLDIESDARSVGLAVSHPLLRTLQQELTLGAALERRDSRTSLLGMPFSFSPGSVDGASTVAPLRLWQQYVARDARAVVAVRSTLSIGLDALGATVGEMQADGRFASWVGQLQWVRRLDTAGARLLARADLQLAGDALPAQEKFAVGGAGSVRGYRENQLVRDDAAVASLEVRVPLPAEPSLQFAPFVDWGRAWNRGGPTAGSGVLWSVGLGLRWEPDARTQAQVYWGRPLRAVENPDHDLQDRGIHFQLSRQFR